MVSLVHLTISFLPWMVSEDAWMMVGHLGKSGGDLILIPELLNWLWAICSTLTKIEVPLLAKGLGDEVVGRTHYTITINVLNGSMVKKIRCSTCLAWQLFVGKTCICQSQRILFLSLVVSGLKKNANSPLVQHSNWEPSPQMKYVQ